MTFTCRECNEDISVIDGLDPADYCNACVHTVLDQLVADHKALRAAAVGLRARFGPPAAASMDGPGETEKLQRALKHFDATLVKVTR